MLKLDRGKGERIVIGNDGAIVITVIEVREHQVRLGIQCPRHIPIWREELLQDMQRDSTDQGVSKP